MAPSEPNENGENGEPTPEDKAAEYHAAIQAELEKIQRYQAAIASEFTVKEDDDKEHEKYRKMVVLLGKDALTTVRHLMSFADSESVRANLAWKIVQLCMESSEKAEKNDYLADLIESMKKGKPVSDPTTAI